MSNLAFDLLTSIFLCSSKGNTVLSSSRSPRGRWRDTRNYVYFGSVEADRCHSRQGVQDQRYRYHRSLYRQLLSCLIHQPGQHYSISWIQ